MKKFFYSILAAIALLLSACNQPSEPVVLHIIHSNDTHSQIDPTTKNDRTYGGVVERASMLEYWRQQDADLLYLDGGDMVQGTPYFNIYGGAIEIECMNMQKLEATTFGNHEFDNGIEGLVKMYSQANFPILSCNYDVSETPLSQYVRRSMIIEKKGVKIGLTGITVSPAGLIFAKNVAGIKYLNPIEETNKVVEELHQQGCDLVVLISHMGLTPEKNPECDTLIASHTRGIDIIISAHSHTNIENGLYVNNLDGKPVLITQTGGKANPMGFLELTMQPCKGENGQRYQLLVDSTKCSKLHPEDYDLSGYGEEMRQYIQPWHDSLDADMSALLGHCDIDMNRRHPQCLLGNFAADALLEIGEKLYNHKMDIAFTNLGGLRSDLMAGDVTLGDLFRIFPFENTVCVVEIKGSDLTSLVHSISGRGLDPVSKGCEVELVTINDRTQEAYFRLNGKNIDPDRTYYLATIDYLAEGNSGYTALLNGKCTNTGIRLRDAMIDYVKELTEKGMNCTAKLDNRVIDHSKKSK